MSAPLRSTGAPDADPSPSLIQPPRMRTGRDASASRLELFFDLAYVLAVFELATTFVHDPTWHGLGVMAGLFAALWFSWVGFTLYANRFDTDDVVFRIGKLMATLTVAGCAASASSATADYGTAFAWSFLAGRVVLALLYVRARRAIPDARPTIDIYLRTVCLSAVLWACSIPVPETARYWLWAAAVAVDASGPILATVRKSSLPLHVEHLPERFGLLVILVLGEAVGGAATGVHDASWVAASVRVGVVGFLVAAGLWWVYFDVVATSSADHLTDEDGDEDQPEADGRHDLFVYGHLPLTLGVVMVGVGIEDLVLHPAAPLPSAGGWILCGGLVLFLLGCGFIVAGTEQSLAPVRIWLLSAVVVGGISFVPYPGALAIAGVVAALTLALAVAGTVRRRKREAAEPPPRPRG